jgi:protein tyrosine phosphatase (PTP) superfamily phosphohydrolase (DUF442 family)
VRALGRLLRGVAFVASRWIGLFVVFQAAVTALGAAARAAGKDPQLHEDGWPAITHLRRVDDKLLFGAQASPRECAQLVERGVTRVIDLRGPEPMDQHNRDDPVVLDRLGIEHVSLPVLDGHAPTPDQVDRFIDLVDEADGLVFAHCGGGVGRSTSLAAAYEASVDQAPSVLEQIAVGPPSLEQIWFVGTLHPGEAEHEVSPTVTAVSRVIDAPRKAWGLVKTLL